MFNVVKLVSRTLNRKDIEFVSEKYIRLGEKNQNKKTATNKNDIDHIPHCHIYLRACKIFYWIYSNIGEPITTA